MEARRGTAFLCFMALVWVVANDSTVASIVGNGLHAGTGLHDELALAWMASKYDNDDVLVRFSRSLFVDNVLMDELFLRICSIFYHPHSTRQCKRNA